MQGDDSAQNPRLVHRVLENCEGIAMAGSCRFSYLCDVACGGSYVYDGRRSPKLRSQRVCNEVTIVGAQVRSHEDVRERSGVSVVFFLACSTWLLGVCFVIRHSLYERIPFCSVLGETCLETGFD